MVNPEVEHKLTDEQSVVHVLWTGGWDSTYRVLMLLEQGLSVQPHYLIDHARHSTQHELQAMDAIRASIREYPKKLSGALLPTKISEKAVSVANPNVLAAYRKILKEFYVGEQYMWLADYCASQGVSKMEIGLEKDPVFLKAVESEGYPYSEVFGRFEFPILSVKKLAMKTWAQENGVLPVLEQSWFCHTPAKDDSPCGVCRPCEVSVKGGMAYRLPLKARARHYFRVIPRVKAFLKKFPRFYRILYSLKRNH